MFPVELIADTENLRRRRRSNTAKGLKFVCDLVIANRDDEFIHTDGFVRSLLSSKSTFLLTLPSPCLSS